MTPNIKVQNDEVIHQGHHLTFQNRTYEQGGKTKQYEMVTRGKVDTIIACLPITTEGKVILTKEFRIPHNDYVLWVPAWLWDKPWENPIDIVKRELVEETAYDSNEIEYAFTTGTSEGLTDEKIDCYIAQNCTRVSDTLALEWPEDIEVIEVEVDKIHEFLLQQISNGQIVWSKLLALLYMYQASLNKIR